MSKIAIYIPIIALACTTAMAAPTTKKTAAKSTNGVQQTITKAIKEAAKTSPYHERLKKEDAIANNPFGISLYKPTYLLPYYFTNSPAQTIYSGITPDNQKVRKVEFKGQISIKVPLWRRIFHTNTNLYAAYTQLSYWQVYTESPYFRETNYEPEAFLSYQVNKWGTVNFGIVHQSNGRGGLLERSWNRVYAEAIFSIGHFMIDVKPWILIFKKGSSDLHNPDITKYFGHGRFLFAYKFHKLELSLMTRNNFESGFRRGSAIIAASYPVWGRFNAYVQYFTGYGQSLIEYNHYTNSIGVGIAFNNWI